jgi:hypothetical protein
MIILAPLWLGLRLWLIAYSSRRQHGYEVAKTAAAQFELQMVAAIEHLRATPRLTGEPK